MVRWDDRNFKDTLKNQFPCKSDPARRVLSCNVEIELRLGFISNNVHIETIVPVEA